MSHASHEFIDECFHPASLFKHVLSVMHQGYEDRCDLVLVLNLTREHMSVGRSSPQGPGSSKLASGWRDKENSQRGPVLGISLGLQARPGSLQEMGCPQGTVEEHCNSD